MSELDGFLNSYRGLAMAKWTSVVRSGSEVDIGALCDAFGWDCIRLIQHR